MYGIIFLLAITIVSCSCYLLMAYRHVKTHTDAELWTLILVCLGSTLIALGYAICKININN